MPANGQWPDSALMVVEDNDRLSHTAGNAFLAFKRYAASQGRTLLIAEPAGAYRSLAVQRDMHANPHNYNLNPASKAGLAAVGKSGHGDANCVDLVGTSLTWIVANAGRFGYSRPLKNDPNHFRHNGVTAASGTAALIEENDMASPWILYRYTAAEPDLWIWVNLAEKTYRVIPPGEQSKAIEQFYGDDDRRIIDDPAWGQNYGNGQFRNLDVVPGAGNGAVDVAELARQLAPLLPDAVTEAELKTALGQLDITVG